MSKHYWVITGFAEAEGEFEYWSNRWGWGSFDEATHFTDEERNSLLLLPSGGHWQRVEILVPAGVGTSGPWVFREDYAFQFDDTLPVYLEFPDGSHEIIAAVWPRGRDDDGMPDAETRANAHLIAAAPQLYEALSQLVNYNEADPDLYVGDDDGVLGRIMYNARVALGAATRRDTSDH